MNVWTIAGIALVTLMILDLSAFYLGKKGVYRNFKSTKIGKKFYDRIHPKLKEIVHQKTLTTIFLAKITLGAALITMAYLGEHISFKKFIWANFAVNAFLCIVFATIASILHISIGSLFETVNSVKIELAIIGLSLAGLLIIDHLLKSSIKKKIRKIKPSQL